jgi:hypothetical protein
LPNGQRLVHGRWPAIRPQGGHEISLNSTRTSSHLWTIPLFRQQARWH